MDRNPPVVLIPGRFSVFFVVFLYVSFKPKQQNITCWVTCFAEMYQLPLWRGAAPTAAHLYIKKILKRKCLVATISKPTFKLTNG